MVYYLNVFQSTQERSSLHTIHEAHHDIIVFSENRRVMFFYVFFFFFFFFVSDYLQ